DEVIEWFDNWLCDEPGRVLIYVGRDYDAAPDYWKTVIQRGTVSDPVEAEVRRAETASRVAFERQALPKGEETCEWFTIDPLATPRDVRTLQGLPDWTDDIDPAKLGIRLNSQLKPDPAADVWLSSEGDTLIASQEQCDSQIITIANGSFLLNMPLVNHEHRRLANRLIGSIGTAEKRVV